MNLQVKITKEHKDGSADALVTVDKEGMELLIQWGLIAILKEAIKNREYNPRPKKEVKNAGRIKTRK
jgi:hypothetical protein